ncbi:hypothetical protein COU60_00765 [Candidatus Pacearchaeota archaeon CG10_big_fil_rev_8_21_14_0_10_34_76]|nr:MAG: hypothetical protein COU60_00765 [Candidatus Pacearchaeota archaeon CG10_big_fil_rev_8_21_14_0_10_34_76]
MDSAIERFIKSNVTLSNMGKLIQNLQLEKEVEEICKANAFNIDLLRPVLLTMMRGYNNKEVAQKLGVHRVTIQRYTHALKKLKESEFEKIKNYVLNIENEEDNKN